MYFLYIKVYISSLTSLTLYKKNHKKYAIYTL